MRGHQCYHCKQWVEEGEAHDCWTTTEAALTADLSDDLREAWERVRETASEFGEQRIYASHHSIMFSRSSCYFFVRPKRQYLQLVVFLGRPVNAPQVRRVEPSSKAKLAHFLRITHRDEVEAPITDWLREAYEYSARPAPNPTASGPKGTTRKTTSKGTRGGRKKTARQKTAARRKTAVKTPRARNARRRSRQR